MKIALILPTYFGADSVIAGGERYAYSLAMALAQKAEVCFFTFGKEKRIYREGPLKIHCSKTLFEAGGVANPFEVSFLKPLSGYDIIHCLQFPTLVTEFAALAGALKKKKVFFTDLAGGTIYCFSRFFPVWKCVREMLLISEFNHSLNTRYPLPHRIIYGGVDTEKFYPSPSAAPRTGFLFVGRIFRAKGIHDAIEALPGDLSLNVVGTCHEPGYEEEIKKSAQGKKVFFKPGIPDRELINVYHASLATVLPSLVDGGFTSAMESMACGIPVIATSLGSLPEIVEDGITGFLVPPHSPAKIREKMLYLSQHPGISEKMGQAARQRVLEKFTWERVADKCLEAYQA
jgi:glycosyltransferase involved in cell wall biosynthesis